MIFVGAKNVAAQIKSLRHPLGVTIAKNDIGASGTMIVAGIGIIIIFPGGIHGARW